MDKITEFFNEVIYPRSRPENPSESEQFNLSFRKRIVCLDCVYKAVKKFIEENYVEKTDGNKPK